MKDESKIKAEEKRQQQESQQIAQGDSEAPIHTAKRTVRAEPEERQVGQELDFLLQGDFAPEKVSGEQGQPWVEGEIVEGLARDRQHRGRHEDVEREHRHRCCDKHSVAGTQSVADALQDTCSRICHGRLDPSCTPAGWGRRLPVAGCPGPVSPRQAGMRILEQGML